MLFRYLNSANQILVTKTMNPADTENPNLLLRERLEKARLSANLIRFFSALLTLNKSSSYLFVVFVFHGFSSQENFR